MIVKGVILAAIILLLSGIVLCDTTAPPCSYKTYSQNKKYFFIMLAPKDKLEVECLGYTKEKQILAKKLRQKFRASGLYTSSEERALWEVDWFSYQVLVSNDGKHVIRIGAGTIDLDGEAITLIENGAVKKTYKLSDLIRSAETLKNSTSHIQWLKDIGVDDTTNTFSVETFEDTKFIFSLELEML
jgi:hypothetical protein